MLAKPIFALSLAIWFATASAADTIFLGRATSNDFVDVEPSCPDSTICLDGWFRWMIKVQRILSGPPLSGRIAAVHMQHVGMPSSYQKRFKLFVVRPIEDAEQRVLFRADFYLEDLSEIHEMFCLGENPSNVGLDIEERSVGVVLGSTRYCFDENTINADAEEK